MNSNNLSSKSVGAGFFAAIVASLCCITPVFSLLAGIGGIAATFSWMEPIRPYLIVFTVGIIGYAWYQKLRPRTKEEIECACEEDERPSFWQTKRFLGIVTVFASVMLAFPSYSHIFYPESQAQVPMEVNTVKVANFDVEGMTCTGCEEHVKFATGQLPGVFEVNASFESGTADIKFESSLITVEEITDAINATGYTVTNSEVSDLDESEISELKYRNLIE